jgi:hypothetical protein
LKQWKILFAQAESFIKDFVSPGESAIVELCRKHEVKKQLEASRWRSAF